MANVPIDISELEYLKSCRDKLRDIANVVKEEKDKDMPAEEKLEEIKRIMGGELSSPKNKRRQG